MKSSVFVLTCLGFAFIGLAIKIYEPDSSASVWLLIIGISLLISVAILRKLAMLMDVDKVLIIYVDRNNPGLYLFDLEI